VTSIIYLFSLSLMARNSSREIGSAIRLRFDNVALLGQLQVKTEIAEAAQSEAEHANAAKSKFLAAASHDLRQPIHAQGLFLEVLSRTKLDDHQRNLVNSAHAASDASSELLNALLDFSRIEAGVIEPQLQPVHLQPILNKIENELAPQADAKEIFYRLRETHLAVQTDPLLLELILRNLVSNAIRYTWHGGILVACRKRGDQAVLEVWDTGIGIAPEHQQEVFREFHQLGNPERDRNKGLGLGLAVADGLSRAMAHDLSMVSIPERGSVFRLSLPLADEVPPDPKAMVQSKTRVFNARILIIDDDEIVREGMLHLLRDWGCECDAAESIEEALALAELNVPDVIISDYRLREQRTGVEAIAAVRALLGFTVPALLITGDTAPVRLREAKASGLPLLHKPVSASKLYRKLVELQQELV
jgi:signal transduction histidine kinase/ActR/RegA family two-component response regulator